MVECWWWRRCWSVGECSLECGGSAVAVVVMVLVVAAVLERVVVVVRNCRDVLK